jgi:hypothetical protein
MSSAKVAVACVAIAVSLSACGVASKPEAGSAQAAIKSAQQLKSSDVRTKHVKCLATHHIPYTLYMHDGHPAIQMGPLPTGPTAVFLASPGTAQGVAIRGQAQAAEVIGSALVYPNQASNRVMKKVEACMKIGVSG